MLKPGEKAPHFTLQTADGTAFSLTDKLKDHAIVLYFYPKNETRGCTAEACSFRDQYEVFKEQGAEVVGVSSDNVASHDKFRQNHRLPFVLLSDPKGEIRKMYKVPKTLGLIPGRVTYVIDREGIVRYAFNSQTKPLEHVAGALDILKSLAGKN